jgi:AcrR family transcriptional regulator
VSSNPVPSTAAPRRRLPKEERAAQIVDVAHAAFAARGYGAVTMDQVAAEVGVTKPLLYAYVGNKEELYLACITRDASGLERALAAAIDSAPDPGTALQECLRAFFTYLEGDRAAWQVLYDETLPAGGQVADAVAAYRARLTDVVAASLRDLLPGEDAARIDALSHLLLGAAESLGRWWLRTQSVPPADAADLLIQTVAPGLARMARP